MSSPHANPHETPSLQIMKRGEAIRMAVLDARRQEKRVGLVTTMGALHAAHLSLIDTSVEECDMTVATVFVNPTQFDDADDLAHYPRDLEADAAKLAERGCDLVFAPAASEMYRAEHETYVEVGPVARAFDGERRPGHFRGVATIVLKLFHLVPADRAYFGQKDYQQTLVVRRMVADFNLPIEIAVCPTVREPDGLAMSSRNLRLSADERRRALSLSQSLSLASEMVAAGERDADAVLRCMRAHIEAVGGVDIEYVGIVKDGTVTPVQQIDGPVVALVAACVGKTRLIDNRWIE